MAVISNSFVKSLCFSIIVLFLDCESARLNVPRVLLPYNLDFPTNYTLEISGGGCYRWTSSRTEVVTITPLNVFADQGCSTKALVSAVSTQRARHSTIILAEDSGNNQLLRCDVIVDVIHAVEIVTTTRELFLEDAPEEFEVTAKNDQEDTFSSLEGVAFEWTLESQDQSGGSAESVLRFLKFADSPYETPEYINQWEQQRLQGDKVLVEGRQAGTSLVRVQLQHASYKNVPKSEVNLIVVANLVLNPAQDVYLLPNSVVRYSVELIKQGRAHGVEMPSEVYFLEIRDSSVAQLNVDKSEVTALAPGHTDIILKDYNSGLLGRDPPRQPSAGIHVIEPSYMIFQVSPGENWALQEFTEYEVTVKLFDDRHHQIYPSENLRVRVHFPSKHFNTNFASANGTYYQVKTLLPGPTKISGELQGILGKDGKTIPLKGPNVKQTQEVIIYQALQVDPSVVLMPWDSIRKPSYTLTLKARGATGSFHWVSNDTTMVSVAYKPDQASKLATLKTEGIGDVLISVKDIHNSIFKSSAMISVQPVADLEILPTVVEAEIGQEIVIPLALYGYEDALKTKRKIFDDCSEVPITVEIVDKTKIEFNPGAKFPAMGSGCRSLAFLCKTVGHSRINIQYSVGDLLLKTTTILACHKPLKPIFPSRVLLLPIGSLTDVAFEGGPRAWPMFQEGHFTTMTLTDTNMARRTLIKDPHRFNRDLHVFRILCKDLGEQVLEISVGNEKSATNQNPAILTASVQLFCGVPESLFLKPVVKGPTGKKLPCPIGEEPVPIPVHAYKKLEVEIWAKDQKGRKFANISSLDITWDVSDYNLAKPENPRDVKIDENSATGFLKLARSYQIIHPAGKVGQVKLTATILGYRSDVLRKEEIAFQERFAEAISRSVTLNLVEDVTVDPSTVTVFNHATNKVILNVSQGSGHFFIEASDESKASVEYSENMRQISVIPLEDGSQSITVHDLCLETQELAVAHVRVSGVEAIQVKMIDKVELNKSVTAVVQVLGHQLQPIPASLFPLIDLQALPSSPLIGASFQGISEDSDTQAKFRVTGLALGHGSLTFQMGASNASSATVEAGEILAKGYRGRPVASSPLPVQVFSPLKLSPSNITLLVGAVLQVTCWGGPQPQSSIEFLLQNQDVAVVSGSGILTATRLGHTTLIARAVDTHPDTGNTVVYSQDQVSVFVVPLNGIKIHSPLRRLQTHSVIPLHIVGLNEHENPFVFGSAIPPLIFKWTVSNPEVLKLQSFYKQPLSQAAGDQHFAVQVVALRPGHATVSLQVELSEVAPEEVKVQLRAQGALLRDEVQFQVFNQLTLIQPAHVMGGDVLITPNTRMQLKSNRDGLARVQYAVRGEKAASLVSVEGTGLLVSKAQAGDSVLTLTAQEEFGLKQTSILSVQVRPLSYLMVSCVSPVRTRERPLNALPIAMTVNLKVTSHDSIGRVFHGSNAQLKFRPSRFDIIQINEGVENGTLIVTASKPGLVVLKVWDTHNPQIADYIPIRVSSAIYPSKSAFHVGDVICFDCPLISSEDQNGWWISESSILNIHPQSGVAVALEPGHSQVHYNISGTQITSSQVTISPVISLTLDPSLVPHVTNVKNARFDVLVFIGENAKQRKSNKYGSNCSSSVLPDFKAPFSCSLVLEGAPSGDSKINQLFQTQPNFDVATGTYMCSLLAQTGDSNVQQENLSFGQGLLLLTVQMGSLQETVRLPFYPAFHVLVQELQLSNVQPTATLGVSAVGRVAELITVTSSDPNVLDILPAESDARMPHTLLFPVHLRDLSSLWRIDTLTSVLHLTVTCTFTKQTLQLPVKLKLLGSSGSGSGGGSFMLPPPPNQRGSWYDNSFLTVIVVLIVTVFALYIGYKVTLGQSRSSASSENVVLTRNSPGYPYIPYRVTDSPDPSRPFLWSLDNSMSNSPRPHTTPQTPPSNRNPRLSFLS